MSSRCLRKTDKADKGPNNNISININFSVKEKSNLFVGKKIDNCVEVNRGRGQRCELQRPNFTVQALKQKKRVLQQTRDDNEKRKKKPQKTYDYTPQKHCKPVEDRSRSKSHKGFGEGYKRKSGKSMEHIRPIRQNSSPSVSRSRSKSGQHSLKKLTRKKRDSKASLGFQNSGIKKKLEEDQSKKTRVTRSSTTQRLREQEFNEIRSFMNEKKKKEKKERENSKKAEKVKADRIKHELRNVEEERKRNALKKNQLVNQFKKRPKSSFNRLPLFCLDDQNFDQEEDYNRLKEDAQKLIHQKDERDRKNRQSTSKSFTKKQTKLLKHYFTGKMTQKEETELTKIAVTIQRFTRGYLIRRQFGEELSLRERRIQINKSKFKLRDSLFWNQESNSNSIIRIEQSSIKMQDPESQRSINEIRMSENYRNSTEKEVNSIDETKFFTQIQFLRKNLQQQAEKYKVLEEQNEKLKAFVMSQHSSAHHNKSEVKSEMEISQKFQPNRQNNSQKAALDQQEEESTPIGFSINEEPRDKQKESPVKETEDLAVMSELNNKSKKELRIETEDLDHYKKVMESYTCSPRGSALSASRVKDPSILEMFRKKELHLQVRFQQRNKRFEQNLRDHLISPRTYNKKIIALERHYQKERDQILARLEEAKRVAQYIKGLEEQEKELSSSDPAEQNAKSEEQQNDTDSNNDIPNNKKWIHAIDRIDDDEEREIQASQKQKHSRHDFEHKIQRQQNQQNQQNQQSVPEQLDPQSKAEQIFQKIRQANEGLGEDSQEQKQSMGNSMGSSKSNAEQKGFETNLTFIKEYCIGLCEFIRAHDHLRQAFWANISVPISYDNFEFLRAYRTTLQHENTDIYNSHRKQYVYPFFKLIVPKIQAIPHQVFQSFNRNYDRLAVPSELKHLQKCYLQSILDAFNEALDHERPGSVFGQQLPWNAHSRHLKNFCNIDFQNGMEEQLEEQKFDQFFGVAIARLIQWGSCLCGFIPQSLQLEPNQKIQFDEEQINHVRQTRMALMLEKAIKEDDDAMVNSELEQTEIRLSVAQLIFEDLLLEAITDADEAIV